MIHYIKGKLALKLNGGIVVETGGIGYEVFLPDNSPLYLEGEGSEISVYTALIVKEDSFTLYGFHNRDYIDFFNKLININGVGAKAAISILSSQPLAELQKAIMFGDVPLITKANGIGKKTAERIILELKDKIKAPGDMNIEGLSLGISQMANGDPKFEAIEALIGLGYSKTEATTAVLSVRGDNITLENYIKAALKGL